MLPEKFWAEEHTDLRKRKFVEFIHFF